MTRAGPHPGASRPVVVGGGVAGLVVAWELARSGRCPLLVEASDRVGGALARHTVAGLEMDAGAESFATSSPAVTELLELLGLAPDIVRPNPVGAWVRHEGGTAPLPAGALLGIPVRPMAADSRRVLGLAGAARAAADRLLPRSLGNGSASLGTLVTARMGRRVVRRLVEPVAGGVYSTDPDRLDLDTVAPTLRAALGTAGSLSGAVRAIRGGGQRPGSAVAGLTGGMFTLVDALAEAIIAAGGEIRTGSPVRALERTGSSWLLRLDGESSAAGQLVLALPGAPMMKLLRGPYLLQTIGSDAFSPSSGNPETNEVLLATLVVDQPELDLHPRGTGVLVAARATGVTAKALTHATAKWAWMAERAGPARHVLRLSYGRAGAPMPEPADLIRVAMLDAAELTGVALTAGALVGSAVVPWTSTLPRLAPGHRAAMEKLRTAAKTRTGLHLTGSFLAGTGLAAVVADARRTAAAVLQPWDADARTGLH